MLLLQPLWEEELCRQHYNNAVRDCSAQTICAEEAACLRSNGVEQNSIAMQEVRWVPSAVACLGYLHELAPHIRTAAAAAAAAAADADTDLDQLAAFCPQTCKPLPKTHHAGVLAPAKWCGIVSNYRGPGCCCLQTSHKRHGG